MTITAAGRIRGRIRLPGDKSISHRAALIATLANGTSRITNFATGADCAATIACLKQLGVVITEKDQGVVVTGMGRQGLKAASAPLDCGNSGSTMRLLAGVLAGQNFSSTLIGDASLSERPMDRVVEPLELMGTTISSNGGKAPLRITGSAALKAISYDLPIASAQVKSAILLAALNAEGKTIVSESVTRSRDHTERMLCWFGSSLTTKADGARYVTSLDGPVVLSARDLSIPGDLSSAAYLITAAALLPKSELILEDIGLNSTRTEYLAICKSLGFHIEITNEHEVSNEPRGDISVSSTMRADRSPATLRLAGPAIAPLIDELPLLAVLGSQIPGGIEIRDAEELRLKESDRISATVKNLSEMGVEVREFDDGLKVSAGRLKATRIESHGDHRIAMAFTVAALLANGESQLDDPNCVSVSFPEFFELFGSIIEPAKVYKQN